MGIECRAEGFFRIVPGVCFCSVRFSSFLQGKLLSQYNTVWIPCKVKRDG